MYDWVDRQMNTKTSKNIKFGHELPGKDNNIHELSKKFPPMASKNPKKLAEIGKINKNLFFFKKKQTSSKMISSCEIYFMK